MRGFWRWLTANHHGGVFVIVGVMALLQPGQNYWQELTLHPQPAAIRVMDITLPKLGPIPVQRATAKKLYVVAEGAIAVDRDSGAVLFAKNPDFHLMPASTTKIMTALVALDHYALDEHVTITDADQSIGHRAELEHGETLTVHDLIEAMLIPSGNDAALALAQHDPLGYSHFVELMNTKAQQLHLANTHYQNVSGVETYDHYSSARDLALLAKEAMKQPAFARIVGTKEKTITSVDGSVIHELKNLNELLSAVPGVVGVKTGWTERAGECLVTYTLRDGHGVIAVILNSPDRFGESRRLIEWAFSSYDWKTL